MRVISPDCVRSQQAPRRKAAGGISVNVHGARLRTRQASSLLFTNTLWLSHVLDEYNIRLLPNLALTYLIAQISFYHNTFIS